MTHFIANGECPAYLFHLQELRVYQILLKTYIGVFIFCVKNIMQLLQILNSHIEMLIFILVSPYLFSLSYIIYG